MNNWVVLLLALGIALTLNPAQANAANQNQTGNGAASADEVTKLQTQLNEKVKKGFVADFSQTLTLAKSNKVLPEKTGQLKFLPPKSFKWELGTRGESEVYVSNGDNLWKYNEKRHHVQKLSGKTQDPFKILPFLKIILGFERLDNEYIVDPWLKTSAGKIPSEEFVTPPNSEGKVLVSLTPKKPSEVSKIYISLNKNSGFVDELRIVYSRGNRWRAKFTNFFPQNLDKKEFDFVPPPGVALDQN